MMPLVLVPVPVQVLMLMLMLMLVSVSVTYQAFQSLTAQTAWATPLCTTPSCGAVTPSPNTCMWLVQTLPLQTTAA
jgi:hypothetical protein